MKRKILTGLASLTLLDLAAGQAAAQPPAPVWTGWYLGGHVGYRETGPDWAAPGYSALVASGPPGAARFGSIPGFAKSFQLNTAIAGAQLGYNWQIDPRWLVGIESDVSFGNAGDRISGAGTGISLPSFDAFTFQHNSELTLQWQATVRARAGYIVDSWLWYVTGGVAFEHARWTDSFAIFCRFCPPPPPVTINTASKTLTGWVVGAGIEQMLTPNWIWRVEYLYENFGDFNVPYGQRGLITPIDMGDVHKVRFGLSYKFTTGPTIDTAAGSRIRP
jgi:outer membrane immunogenic protein